MYGSYLALALLIQPSSFSVGKIFQLKDLDQVLCRPMGKTLAVEGDVKNVMVYVKTAHASPQYILTRVAKAANATLTESKDGWTLRQLPGQLDKEKADETRLQVSRADRILAMMRSQTEDIAAEMTADEARDINVELGKHVGGTYLFVRPSGIDPLYFNRPLPALPPSFRTHNPAQRLTDRILRSLPPQIFGAFIQGKSIAIYAWKPNERQRPLPMQLDKYIQMFEHESKLWEELVPEGRPSEGNHMSHAYRGPTILSKKPIANIIFQVRLRDDAEFGIQMLATDLSGAVVASCDGAIEGIRLRKFAPPFLDGPVNLQEDSKEYKVVTNWGAFGDEKFHRLHQFLVDHPDHEPLNYWVLDCFNQGLSKRPEVLGVVPDVGSYDYFDPQEFRQWEKEIRFQMRTDELTNIPDDSALIFRPTNYTDYKITTLDRVPFHQQLRTVVAATYGHTPEHFQHWQYLPRSGSAAQFVPLMIDRCGVQWFEGEYYHPLEKVLAKAPAKWLVNGGEWPYNSWPQEVKDEIAFQLAQFDSIQHNYQNEISMFGNPKMKVEHFENLSIKILRTDGRGYIESPKWHQSGFFVATLRFLAAQMNSQRVDDFTTPIWEGRSVKYTVSLNNAGKEIQVNWFNDFWIEHTYNKMVDMPLEAQREIKAELARYKNN